MTSPPPRPTRNATRPKGPVTVVVVGQVPPPTNGQALMIQEFLAGEYSGLHLVHVPMVFSRSTSEIGSFGFRKLLLLVRVLMQIFAARMRTKATILYYPPAGPNLVPVLRDLVLLIPTRWLFRRTVFHFHAAGLYEIYPRLPMALRPLFRKAYNKPDLAIFTTLATSAEAMHLHAERIAVVPCGIADQALANAEGSPTPGYRSGQTPTILFAGILCEGKGILVLVEACTILLQRRIPFRLLVMGAFQSEAFEQQTKLAIEQAGLKSHIAFLGVLTGKNKHEAFVSADIFCFPSHYAAESFGVVLIEAMSYSLPIVATNWRGIPEVTGPEGGARLVPVREPAALAEALEALLLSDEPRRSMGGLNRARYLDRFTLEQYRDNLRDHLLALA